MSTTACKSCRIFGAGVLALATVWPASAADTPERLLAAYSQQAGGAPSAERGRQLFTSDFGQPLGWSCASCHGPVPTRQGKDLLDEKTIEPLAPAANPRRFTDRGKVERSFAQNCKDVVGRACTAAEKADVLSWLISLRP